MLLRTGVFTWMIGTGIFSATQPITYSYWSWILPQAQPVQRSWTTDIITWGTYDSSQYIWSEITIITWNLSWILPTYTNQTGTYTIQPLSSVATDYTLFGHLLWAPYSNTISTSTWITLSTWDGTKRIITQIYNPFATHFENSTILDQTNPSVELISPPASWSAVTWTDILLTRSWNDATAGISGYTLYVLSGIGGTTFLSSWTTFTGLTVSNLQNQTYEIGRAHVWTPVTLI